MDGAPETQQLFGAADYAVFGAMLALCAAIGLYFALAGRRPREGQATTADDYLMGGRRMGTLPVSMSLIASIASGGGVLQGGLKAVVWTDVVQTIAMFGSLLLVVAKGTADVGGVGVVWQRAQDSGRLQKPKFSSTHSLLFVNCFKTFLPYLYVNATNAVSAKLRASPDIFVTNI